MSVDKFKFISPGIFVNEIDNTGRNVLPGDIGPVIVGRSEKGPILRPTQVNDFADFVNEFGMPIPGGNGSDVSRYGNYIAPTYAAYAAQAWLRNNSPITYVRLGGRANVAATTTAGLAGWSTTELDPTDSEATNGGAYGLFITTAPDITWGSASIVLSASNDLTALGNTLDATSFIALYYNSNTVPLFTITASDSAKSAPGGGEGKSFTAEWFSTGSGGANGQANPTGSSNLYKNITGSLDLAISASGYAGYFSIGSASSGEVGPGGPHDVGLPTIVIKAANSGSLITNSLPTLKLLLATSGSRNPWALSASQGGSYLDTNPQNTANNTPSTNLAASSSVTGTLAAIWYLDQACAIGLSGTSCGTGDEVMGTSFSVDGLATQRYKVRIRTEDETLVDSSFDFTDTSDQYIRKVFNTNPTLTNNQITDSSSRQFTRYWLGETFEGALKDSVGTTGATLGVILPLQSGSTANLADRRKDHQNAHSGWFISQDMTQGITTGSFNALDMQKLFRVVARNSGDWSSRDLKVSIQDIKRSPSNFAEYGSFTLALRKMSDTDNRVEYVQQFNNLNLNPNSENYIARRIGNRYRTWNEADRRYREYGDYVNNSDFIRVEMNAAVDKGDTDPQYLPFGVIGVPIYKPFTDTDTQAAPDTMVTGSLDDFGETVSDFISGSSNGKIKYTFPKLYLRQSASQGNPVDPKNVFFGVDTTFGSSRFNPSVMDHLKPMSRLTSDFPSSFSATDNIKPSFVFTLDDMMYDATDGVGATLALGQGANVYVSGSRQATPEAVDPTSVRGPTLTYVRGTGSYTRVIEDAGADRFTTVLFGGFNGLEIREAEPTRTVNANTTDDPKTDYMMNSIQVAIDSLRDPEVVEYNIATMPGIVNNTLNRSLIDMCEARGDALAVVDLKHGYTPRYETADAETVEGILGDVDDTINNARNNLTVNSSYGAAYYPWVQIKDLNTGQLVWAPPSVAALGAMSYGQKSSELWFAPAGFTRGGLSNGSAGLPVTAVRERLTAKQRDKLYEANINPIAQFPAEGIVIFGQKTLQVTPSALDRINVRRLLIYLKRQISRFAATVLFDQNVRSTWNRFTGRVEPFLASVQSRLGITNFKLVLDEATTTQDLIDRNIMYAKIYIQPARAIEYIALDFILTDNGAAFED